MRIGVRVPPGPPSARLERLIGRLVEGGFDSLWWGDHLMGFSAPELWEGSPDPPSLAGLHTYSDPFVVMAWAAGVVGSTAVGTCVTDPIRRMPATLAQTALTLNHTMSGPVILGVGAGEVANYKPYGWSVPSPVDRLAEAARQIRFFFDSSVTDRSGAIVGLSPAADRPHPELWLAAHGPRGLRLTGEYADGWLPVALDPEGWIRAWRTIEAAARSAGRPGAVTAGLSLDIVIQDTRAEAESLLAHPVVRQSCLVLPPSVFASYGADHPLGGSAFNSLIPTRDGRLLLRAARAIPDALVRDHIVHGTVDEVAEAIGRYQGLEHIRLSDLSGAVRGGGGLDRLIALADRLRDSPASS